MPVSPELEKYVAEARGKGLYDDVIRQGLLKAGWREENVQEAMTQIVSSSTDRPKHKFKKKAVLALAGLFLIISGLLAFNMLMNSNVKILTSEYRGRVVGVQSDSKSTSLIIFDLGSRPHKEIVKTWYGPNYNIIDAVLSGDTVYVILGAKSWDSGDIDIITHNLSSKQETFLGKIYEYEAPCRNCDESFVFTKRAENFTRYTSINPVKLFVEDGLVSIFTAGGQIIFPGNEGREPIILWNATSSPFGGGKRIKLSLDSEEYLTSSFALWDDVQPVLVESKNDLFRFTIHEVSISAGDGFAKKSLCQQNSNKNSMLILECNNDRNYSCAIKCLNDLFSKDDIEILNRSAIHNLSYSGVIQSIINKGLLLKHKRVIEINCNNGQVPVQIGPCIRYLIESIKYVENGKTSNLFRRGLFTSYASTLGDIRLSENNKQVVFSIREKGVLKGTYVADFVTRKAYQFPEAFVPLYVDIEVST